MQYCSQSIFAVSYASLTTSATLHAGSMLPMCFGCVRQSASPNRRVCWLMSMRKEIRLVQKRSRKYCTLLLMKGSKPNFSLYSMTPWAIVCTTSLCLFRILIRISRKSLSVRGSSGLIFSYSNSSSKLWLYLFSSPGLDQFDRRLALKIGGQQGDFPHRIGQPHCQFFPQKHVGGFFTCIFPAWLNKRQEQVILCFPMLSMLSLYMPECALLQQNCNYCILQKIRKTQRSHYKYNQQIDNEHGLNDQSRALIRNDTPKLYIIYTTRHNYYNVPYFIIIMKSLTLK